eukprot:scaffold1588_cov408-Prasinococcus_capsulatus_cf.AAC.3
MFPFSPLGGPSDLQTKTRPPCWSRHRRMASWSTALIAHHDCPYISMHSHATPQELLVGKLRFDAYESTQPTNKCRFPSHEAQACQPCGASSCHILSPDWFSRQHEKSSTLSNAVPFPPLPVISKNQPQFPLLQLRAECRSESDWAAARGLAAWDSRGTGHLKVARFPAA